MKYGTISADIVESTSLSKNDLLRLQEHIQSFINSIPSESEEEWSRIVKGDSVEIVTDKPGNLLRLALMLKCYIRMFIPENNTSTKFQRYGIRISLGVGDLRINDKKRGILDGESIYLSGRGLSTLSESNSDTLLFNSSKEELNGIDVICSLLDAILNKATSRQCEIIFYKLQKYNEQGIADILGIKQSAVNQHATSASWNAIAKAIIYFENNNLINE